MSRARLLASRSVRVAAACAAALVLSMPPAGATVTPLVVGGTLTLDSDLAGDTIQVACVGGQVKDNGGPDLLACAALQNLNVNGNAGADTIDLTAMQPADFPALKQVALSAGADIDVVKGSFFGDIITADGQDTVQAFGGDDVVQNGDSVFGGDGDDVLTQTVHTVQGGPGDDRIVNPGVGPYDGGPGYDSLEADFAQVLPDPDTKWVITDSILHVEIPAIPASVDNPSTTIEKYVVTLGANGAHTWDSTAYSGDAFVTGGRKGDVFAAGPGSDVIDGRGGNDTVTGGAGVDRLRGGTGDDTIKARDGVVDRVDCGDGTDSVEADFDDVLSGCENVSLPQPVTGAIKGPKKVKQGVKAKFTFTSATPLATFQCKLDKKAWKACKSPFTVATKNLKASATGARHVLRVRAVRSGVVDATPSKKIFKVTKP